MRTLSGAYKINGLIKITAKIRNVEEYINVFIIDNENFKYEKFKLIQNEKLEIEQKSEQE